VELPLPPLRGAAERPAPTGLADRLAAVLSRPGAEITRSSAARAALLRGLDAIEAETSESAKQRSLASKPVKKKTAKK
jgi:hypothetical protein